METEHPTNIDKPSKTSRLLSQLRSSTRKEASSKDTKDMPLPDGVSKANRKDVNLQLAETISLTEEEKLNKLKEITRKRKEANKKTSLGDVLLGGMFSPPTGLS
jgi:hypothetical protein